MRVRFEFVSVQMHGPIHLNLMSSGSLSPASIRVSEKLATITSSCVRPNCCFIGSIG
jgi:hypothetical protein